MTLEEAKQFVARFTIGDYTPEEYRDFLQWLKWAKTDELDIIADAHEALTEEWIAEQSAKMPTSDWVYQLESKLDRQRVNRPFGRSRWFRPSVWMAAASVAGLFGLGIFILVQQNKNEHKTYSKADFSQSLYNPRGAQEKVVTLKDGSKVWLNAASSLKYPENFNNEERVVELSGEAFFQVAPNSSKPFRVLIKDAQVEVLGTDFNVKAYEDDSISQTTLVKGAVKVESGTQVAVLKPGQQAEVANPVAGVEVPIKVYADVDMGLETGWKDGKIVFDDANLNSIMKTISRVYNVEYHINPDVPATRLAGSLPRTNDLATTLSQLHEYLKLNFNYNGKTITVSI